MAAKNDTVVHRNAQSITDFLLILMGTNFLISRINNLKYVFEEIVLSLSHDF